jgi:uncharacterized membrane protein YedE/YeeE
MLFGFVLGWARLTDYDVIRDMLLLRQFDVFFLMMSAMATAAVGVRMLRRGGVRAVVDWRPIGWTIQPVRSRHVIGSVVFGMGWSLAGTCPGPLAAQLGRGQLSAVFTIAGLFAGIALHDRVRVLCERRVAPPMLREDAAVAGL